MNTWNRKSIASDDRTMKREFSEYIWNKQSNSILWWSRSEGVYSTTTMGDINEDEMIDIQGRGDSCFCNNSCWRFEWSIRRIVCQRFLFHLSKYCFHLLFYRCSWRRENMTGNWVNRIQSWLIGVRSGLNRMRNQLGRLLNTMRNWLNRISNG